jgi:DNA-binding CsgD family transcriptional regulator
MLGDAMTAHVGRIAELRSIETFLDALAGGTRALLLEGEAGIGKTTLVDEALRRARASGIQVAVAHVSRPDTSLSYAALGDLFDGVQDTVLDGLPQPQREALDVALLRTPSGDVVRDPRAVSLATLAVVRRVCASQLLVIAIDDLQWLDQSSARVIVFVLQRLGPEPVGLLVTRRTGDEGELPLDLVHALSPERVERVDVGPLSPGDFGHVLRERVGAELPRSLVMTLHRAAGGNPFYGQEMAREILRRGVPAPGAPLPMPKDVAGVVQRRTRALPEDTRALLTAVALASRPTVALVRAAVPHADVEEALTTAEADGLLTVRQDRLMFAHPIFASAVTATTPAADLRAMHARLASVLDEPEERARHLALSSLGADPRIAMELDGACKSARGRGAAAAAAELALLAQIYTPEGDTEELTRRRVVAGLLAFEAGDATRSHELLREALDAIPAGPARARVMITVCEISWQDTVGVEELASRALEQAGDDEVTAGAAHVMLAWVWVYRGDLGRATHHVEEARRLCGHVSDPSVRTDLHTIDALVAFLRGDPFEDSLAEAVRLEDLIDPSGPADGSTIYSSARVVRGLVKLWAGDHDGARRSLEAELAAYEARGRYVARDEVLCYLAHLACRTGEWNDAERYADECLDIGEESGHLRGRGQNLVPRAWLAALRGDLEAARADAYEGLELSLGHLDRLAAAGSRAVLGFVELSDGRPEAAVDHLREAVQFLRELRTAEPGLVPFVADAVEALVAAGLLDEAQAIVDDDFLMGRRAPGAWLQAAPLRGAAMLVAARGDLEGATALLERIVAGDALASQPFERARSLMVLGEVERRRKRRAQARVHIIEAKAVFDVLGARAWAELTALELARLGSAAAAAAELSPTEARIAELVAAGMTNRQAADRMFVSVKTIEANLSRVYRKLGIRSRGELVRLLVADGGALAASPRDPFPEQV